MNCSNNSIAHRVSQARIEFINPACQTKLSELSVPVEMYRKKKTARDTASVGSALAVLAIIPFEGDRVKRFSISLLILCGYD